MDLEFYILSLDSFLASSKQVFSINIFRSIKSKLGIVVLTVPIFENLRHRISPSIEELDMRRNRKINI